MNARTDVGDRLPEVALTGADGDSIRLSDLGGQPLVLFFYPKDDTPGCTVENKDFSDLADAFEAAGVALWGVSRDSPARHARFTAKHGLKTRLATDAQAGGLAEALGIRVEKVLYGRKTLGVERTTYLVDGDGRVARVWRKVKVAGHAEEVLTAARELVGRQRG